MADKMLNAFDVWITAQGVKSRTRLRSVDNVSLEGIEKLRELILEFAIQGKLVSQNSKDEPASSLILKMAKEERELVEKRIIKKPKELPPIEESEFPFELPRGWAYTRLNNIGEWGAGATPLRGRHDYYGGDIPWFKSGELSGDFISKSEETVTELALKQTSLRYNKVGDVLIAMYGATIGKSSILEVPATTNQAVCACTPFSGVYNVFLLKLLRAYNNRFINMGAGGAQPNISREKIIATVIALPPLAEQHRIVAKVDELMALCDALEQQEMHHLKSHQLLVETLLGALTRAADASEFQQAWNKLYEHFNDLFTTEDSIDQLKQTILQLAVMGKLVPQDPNDEPASELLKKIAKERESLLEEGKIKRQKQPLEIKKHEMSFEIPKDWSWCRLNDIVRFSGGGTPSMSRNEYWGGEIPWISPKDMSDKYVSNSEMKITKEGVENSTAKMIPRGSLLVVARSGILKRRLPVAINKVDCTVNQDIKVLIPYNPEINKYLLLMFSGLEKFILENYVKIGTTVHSLKYESFEIMPVPIPPIKEQHRIIAKVDELFALCDRLKGRIAEAQKVANQIAEGVVMNH